MRGSVFLSALLVSVPLYAGQSMQSRQSEIQNLTRSKDPKSLPGFETDFPPEMSLNDIDALEDAASTAFDRNKEAQVLKKIAETRPYFVVDGDHDPIFKNAKEAATNPKAFLDGPVRNKNPQTTYERKVCRESRPNTELKCSKILLAPKIHIEPAKYSNYWCSAGNHRPDDPHCGAKTYFSPARKYQDEVVTIVNEEWTNGCHTLEKKAKTGICRRVKVVCPKGKETREVSGNIGTTDKVESRLVTRPCWRYEEVYECSHPSPNNCEPLRQSSCQQLHSKCITKIGTECVEWEQTYRCPKDSLDPLYHDVSKGGYEPPEIEADLSYEANTEMNDALAKLSIFQEIQKGMRADGSLDSITVFKGNGLKCTLGFANYKNCCTTKGWGDLNSCGGEEKDLAERQKRGLCVEVGSYCAEKVFGVCIRKKRSSCCFPSKLARIVHEQGRAQLGLSWGEVESPNCRGFTPEELSRINFDQLNLSEILEEVAARAKTVSAKVVKRKMKHRVDTMTRGFTNQSESGDY